MLWFKVALKLLWAVKLYINYRKTNADFRYSKNGSPKNVVIKLKDLSAISFNLFRFYSSKRYFTFLRQISQINTDFFVQICEIRVKKSKQTLEELSLKILKITNQLVN